MTNTASFRAPRGTYDRLPPGSRDWQKVVREAEDLFGRAGYFPVDTPAFEHTEVFERGVGEASEVVGKQMYTFEDRGGRSLTLRPEGTAPVVRAVIEHGLQRGALPVKLAYSGFMFRQERPQKGRFRQFFQLGIEAIGSASALTDAEVIEIGHRFLRDAGVEPRLLVNSIGHSAESCRRGYLRELQGFLTDHSDELATDDRERIGSNPLRTFDSKEAATTSVMADAPVVSDHLCAECRAHFELVQSYLTDLSVDYEIDTRLVRGLDYYTRTAFEWVAGGLGSQNAVGGGGRYDGLSEALGGPSLPGIGFAIGMDRVMEARSGGPDVDQTARVYVVALGDDARREGLMLVTSLRRAGISAAQDLSERGMKGQMKDAVRMGADWAVILGEKEMASKRATLKNLHTQDQESVDFGSIERAVRS
ncbi:MAG: histidine--tRNA ligase [Actinobacteria bacterium]|nr:histidine--tRNA ligase [Actinomycetota bacterium]